MNFDTEKMRGLLQSRLKDQSSVLQTQFRKVDPALNIRFAFLEDLLPPELCERLYQDFLNSRGPQWRRMKSFRESKWTSKNFDALPSALGEVTFAFQAPEILNLLEEITGISSLVADPGLYAGGLSLMKQGDFLDPHIDNSHDQTQSYYRRLNLLYYVTPAWTLEDGGHLELWNHDLSKAQIIESRFNRLVIMETHQESFHSVSKISNAQKPRCCISNYNFTLQSPTGKNHFHVTSFKARPEQRLKNVFFTLDRLARSGARKIRRQGFGKKDLYRNEKIQE